MKEVLTIMAGIVLTAQAPIGLSLSSPLMEKRKESVLFYGLAAFEHAYHALPFPLHDRHRGLPEDPRSLSPGLCACDEE